VGILNTVQMANGKWKIMINHDKPSGLDIFSYKNIAPHTFTVSPEI
jgi:hypothetical protein